MNNVGRMETVTWVVNVQDPWVIYVCGWFLRRGIDGDSTIKPADESCWPSFAHCVDNDSIARTWRRIVRPSRRNLGGTRVAGFYGGLLPLELVTSFNLFLDRLREQQSCEIMFEASLFRLFMFCWTQRQMLGVLYYSVLSKKVKLGWRSGIMMERVGRGCGSHDSPSNNKDEHCLGVAGKMHSPRCNVPQTICTNFKKSEFEKTINQ